VDDFEYLRLTDFLAIAECNTCLTRADLTDNAELMARAHSALWSATSPAYATLVAKAAVLEFNLIRSRPLPHENVVVAHECMKEFAYRNGYSFEDRRSDINPNELFKAIIDGAPDALSRLTAWLHNTLIPSS